MKRSTRESGFTLIELLVAIIILGVLIAAGVGSFMSSQTKGRDVKRKNDLRQIGLALETYYNDKGHYPVAVADGRIGGCAPDGQSVCDWGYIFQAEVDGAVYMVNLPTESTSGQKYFYISDTGANYQLYTRLENTLDADIPKSAEDEPRLFTDVTCGAANDDYCNYGISSSNISVESGRTLSCCEIGAYGYSQSSYYSYTYSYSQSSYYAYSQSSYYCFLPDTQILLASGATKAIQDVREGDVVVSYDTNTHAMSQEKVVNLIVHSQVSGTYLIINGSLRVTSNHPMWINGQWKPAGDARVGDVLIGDNGQPVSIDSISESAEGVHDLYNLHLEGNNHDYFAEGFLVHNK